MSQSEKNLKEAFAGESQANRRYLAFAQKAADEGFPQVARLFRAAAEAETIHALNHLRALGAVQTTRANLQEAVGGETHEFTQMYPRMIAEAEAEKNEGALRTFNWANAVEKTHAALYQKLLDNLDGDLGDYPYWVCPVCGHTAENEPPERCPVCNAKGSRFLKIS
jgi:rubrerythrin